MFFFLKEKVCTSSWYKYTLHAENLYYLYLLRLHKVTGLLHII